MFIDPALLELCSVPEFANAKSTVEEYFSNGNVNKSAVEIYPKFLKLL